MASSQKNTNFAPAFAQSLSKKSYLICCVVTIKQFNLLQNIKLQGLDAKKMYTVKETNLMPGKVSELECNGKQYSGDYLMKIGLNVFTAQDGTSHVLVFE